MTPPETAAPADAGVRNYTFLCLVALLGVLLVLLLALPRMGTLWLLLPVLIGLAGVLLRWPIAPPLFLLALGGMLYVAGVMRTPLRPGMAVTAPTPGTDLLLAVGALAYVAGHYRLQSLVKAVFPRDPRRAAAPRRRPGTPAARRPPAQVPQQRSPRLAVPGELAWLLLALPSWALLAFAAYRFLVLADAPSSFGDDQPWSSPEWSEVPGAQAFALLAEVFWRGRLLLWVLGGGTLVVAGLLGHFAWGMATRAEADVFLHDTMWRETRREQRLLHAWRVWARWRRDRGKDEP